MEYLLEPTRVISTDAFYPQSSVEANIVILKNTYHLKYLEERIENGLESPYDEKIIKVELAALLISLLEGLLKGCSRVLTMSYIDGLKNSEITE